METNNNISTGLRPFLTFYRENIDREKSAWNVRQENLCRTKKSKQKNVLHTQARVSLSHRQKSVKIFEYTFLKTLRCDLLSQEVHVVYTPPPFCTWGL